MLKNRYDEDVAKLSPWQKDLMEKGLCPKCESDTFEGRTVFLKDGQMLVCAGCKYISRANLFTPRNVI